MWPILIMSCLGGTESSRQDARRRIESLEQSVFLYAAKHHGELPRSAAEFALATGGRVEDPWGHPFLYVASYNLDFCILSLGRDGKVGGLDYLDADVVCCLGDEISVANTDPGSSAADGPCG